MIIKVPEVFDREGNIKEDGMEKIRDLIIHLQDSQFFIFHENEEPFDSFKNLSFRIGDYIGGKIELEFLRPLNQDLFTIRIKSEKVKRFITFYPHELSEILLSYLCGLVDSLDEKSIEKLNKQFEEKSNL